MRITEHAKGIEEIAIVDETDTVRARVLLLTVLHGECLDYDGTIGAGRLLWETLSARVRAMGCEAVIAAGDSTNMLTLLKRHATKLPGEHYVLEVASCRQQ